MTALVAAWTPPLSLGAHRYVVDESLQFALLACVVPALGTLGAPLGRIGSIPRLRTTSAFAKRIAGRRRADPRARAAFPALAAYLVALVAWQLPALVDAVRSSPSLLAAQSLTFAVVGGWYWSELVESAPIVPRTRGAVRAGLAVVPMWAIWVIAYFIGFARSTWFPAFVHGGSAISRVADQQLATGVLWFVSAGVFLPVIFVNFLRFLSDLDPRVTVLSAASRAQRVVRRGAVRPRSGSPRPVGVQDQVSGFVRTDGRGAATGWRRTVRAPRSSGAREARPMPRRRLRLGARARRARRDSAHDEGRVPPQRSGPGEGACRARDRRARCRRR